MLQTIQQLGNWLARFPYENVTKLDSASPRNADRVLREFDRSGTGGTCFSLVNLALKRARNKDLTPRVYLGDRPDGEARHCVIGFPRKDVFLDPGYLCYTPLPLHPVETTRITRPQNTIHLEPVDDTHLKIMTERKNQRTWRYTLTTEPVTQSTFQKAWEESFGWKSVMSSRVLTRQRENDMLLYLNGRLESIHRERRRRLEPPQDQPHHRYLAELFNIQPTLLEDLSIDT
ncbi:MAG: hypothetical protein ABEJ65_00750 [bacterium]